MTHGRADTRQDIPAKPVAGFILAKTNAAGWAQRAGAPHFALETMRDLHVALHHLKSSRPLAAHWDKTQLNLCFPRTARLTEPLMAALWGS